MPGYVRKTRDVWTLQGLYAGGWEDVTEELSWSLIRKRRREYQENDYTALGFRIKKRRERI